MNYILLAISLCLLAPGITLQAAEIDYKELYRATAPAVVLIFGTDGKVAGTGTGSIIDGRGIILTNSHVVANNGKVWEQLYVISKPAKVTGNPEVDFTSNYPATVLVLNPELDLALLQIQNTENETFPTLPLSDLDGIDIGEPVVAIGHPGGGAPWSLTTGKLSASWENYNQVPGWDVFQTETSLNPGNSGGPLLDGTGAIIGINTFINRKNESGLALTGLNFAVKASTARSWIMEKVGSLPDATTQGMSQRKAAKQLSAKTVAQAEPNKSVKEPPPIDNSSSEHGEEVEIRQVSRKGQTFSSRIGPGREFSDKELDQVLSRIDKVHSNFHADPFFKGF